MQPIKQDTHGPASGGMKEHSEDGDGGGTLDKANLYYETAQQFASDNSDEISKMV